jgi:hypothetical protein
LPALRGSLEISGWAEGPSIGHEFTISCGAVGGHVVGLAFLPIAHLTVAISYERTRVAIDPCATAGNVSEMDRCRAPLDADGSALLAAATRLHEDASEPASVELLSSSLADTRRRCRHSVAQCSMPPTP